MTFKCPAGGYHSWVSDGKGGMYCGKCGGR